MATIKNLIVKLGLDFDDSGVSRLTKGIDRVAGRINRMSGALDKARVPAFAVGLTAAAGAASSFAVALVPAVAASLALPAAFAATKVASATLKVALTGVGDAMSAVASGDAKQLEESLKKLSPNARAFVKETGKLSKSFAPIRKVVQDKLFEGLDKGIGKVGKNLLPTVKKGMVGVAGAFNLGAKEALKFGQSPIAKGALSTVFKLTTSVLKEAATAVQPVLKAVAKLVVLGAPLARQMASWAISGIKSGAAFVNSAKGAGKLTEWVKRAGTVLGTLGRIGRNLVGGLINVFKQANVNGGDFLGTLEKMTAKFAAWASSAKGQEQTANAFKLLGDVARGIVKVLPFLIGPLGAIVKLITMLPPDVQETVTTMIAFGVVAGVVGGKLAGVAAMGVKAASTMLQFGAGVAKGSAGLANNASAASKAGAGLRTFGGFLASGIRATAAMVVQLAAMAGAWLLNTTRMVAAKIAMVATTVASKAMAIGIRLVNAAMKANPIGIVITLIVALVAILVVAYKKNETFRNIVNAVWKGIQTAISYAWNKVIKPVLTALWTFIVRDLGPKIMWLQNNVVKPIFSALGKTIAATWNNVIKPVFSFLAKTVTQTIPNAFRTAVTAIGKAWDKVKEVAKAPVRFVVNTVYNNGIARIWNWVADKTGLGRLPLITGFAKGGILPGFSRKDDQLIAARSGEGILVPEAVKALGSNFIHMTNAAARNGGVRGVIRAVQAAGDPSMGMAGIPHFENGGIVGAVTGFFGKAKDFFVNGFIKAAQIAMKPMIDVARNTIGKTAWGGMLVGAIDKIVNGALGAFKPFETELGGGGGMKAVNAARKYIGTPYSWGGGGPNGPSYGIGRGAGTKGFDCSGLTEYAWYQALGKSIGGVTYSQKQILKPISGPRPGAVGQPHSGHTYLASSKNRIIEAPFTGGFVREVPMRSTPWWGWPPWKMDNGGILEPGGVARNLTREPEYVFTKNQTKQMARPTGDTITLIVQVPPTADKAAIGKEVFEVLKEYKRRSGRRLEI